MISLNLILEQVLLEGKYEEIQKKYVGSGPTKITQEQFDEFWNFSKDKEKFYKLVDPLLYLVVHSKDKDRFFNDKDYESYYEKQNGPLSIYITNYFAIKRSNPKYGDLKGFETLDNFRREMSKYVKSEKVSNLSELDRVKLENANIKEVGSVDGFNIYKIPRGKGSNETWNVYRNIICQGKTNFCTASNFNTFKEYLKADALYLLIKNSDPKSPYQFHFQSESFNDRNNNSII